MTYQSQLNLFTVPAVLNQLAAGHMSYNEMVRLINIITTMKKTLKCDISKNDNYCHS